MVGNRLFGQVFLANLAITVILALAIGAFAAYQSRQSYLEREASELEAAVRLCAARIERLPREPADRVRAVRPVDLRRAEACEGDAVHADSRLGPGRGRQR